MHTLAHAHLHADDWPAVCPVEALELNANLRVQRCGEVHEEGLQGAQANAGGVDEPVGEAAVAALAMCPRSRANENAQIQRLRRLHKRSQVSLVFPAPHTSLLLMMDPENIGADDGESVGLGRRECVFPLTPRDARELNLTHAWEKRPVIDGEILRVEAHLAPRGRRIIAHGGDRGRRDGLGKHSHRFQLSHPTWDRVA
jgi:hypothetical protein